MSSRDAMPICAVCERPASAVRLHRQGKGPEAFWLCDADLSTADQLLCDSSPLVEQLAERNAMLEQKVRLNVRKSRHDVMQRLGLATEPTRRPR